jgi:hypothetical protein
MFCPALESVLLALSLELLVPSIHQATPRPPFVYLALSCINLVVATPWLGPSSPASTCYGALPESWQFIQNLGLSQGKSSTCLLSGYGSPKGIERIHRCSLSLSLGLLCSLRNCIRMCHTFLLFEGTYYTPVLSTI